MNLFCDVMSCTTWPSCGSTHTVVFMAISLGSMGRTRTATRTLLSFRARAAAGRPLLLSLPSSDEATLVTEAAPPDAMKAVMLSPRLFWGTRAMGMTLQVVQRKADRQTLAPTITRSHQGEFLPIRRRSPRSTHFHWVK